MEICNEKCSLIIFCLISITQNARDSPDYVANTGGQDLFRTAREVKDFVEGRTPVPKFATYKQLDNFLGLIKKLAKCLTDSFYVYSN